MKELGMLLNKNTGIKRPKIGEGMEVCGKVNERHRVPPPPSPPTAPHYPPPRWLRWLLRPRRFRWWAGLTGPALPQGPVWPVHQDYSAACLSETPASLGCLEPSLQLMISYLRSLFLLFYHQLSHIDSNYRSKICAHSELRKSITY